LEPFPVSAASPPPLHRPSRTTVKPPRRWPWLALVLAVGIAAIGALAILHAREQHARRAEMQATLFATDLRDSVRQITLVGRAIPAKQLAPALTPVIASTARTANERVERLSDLLASDTQVMRMRLQLLQVTKLATSQRSSILSSDHLTLAANQMADTADAIAAQQHDHATLIARETIAGGALAIALSLAIVGLALQHASRLVVRAGRRQARMLQELADHDPLTGLANRRRLADDLARLAPQATAEEPVQVMICDLDGFKGLNDTLGHEAGDEILIAFADEIADAAGEDGDVYRLGGDEFCVLSKPGADVASMVTAALSCATSAVRGSAGMALWPVEAPSARGAMRLADERMYEVKAAQREAAEAA
jgi:diguanylate cyclase (GGDEF)-like protein